LEILNDISLEDKHTLKGVKYKMIKPYDFVPFLPYKPYDDVKAERGDGKIPIRVKTLTPVHISSENIQ